MPSPAPMASAAARATARSVSPAAIGTTRAGYDRHGGDRANDEVGRRPEDRVSDEGRRDRVDAHDDRDTGDAGVAQRLRHGEGRDDESGEQVAANVAEPVLSPRAAAGTPGVEAHVFRCGLYVQGRGSSEVAGHAERRADDGMGRPERAGMVERAAGAAAVALVATDVEACRATGASHGSGPRA